MEHEKDLKTAEAGLKGANEALKDSQEYFFSAVEQNKLEYALQLAENVSWWKEQIRFWQERVSYHKQKIA